MLTLNAVVETQMMLDTQVAQTQQLSWKTPKKLHKLILAHHKLKLCEIAEELKISEGTLFLILHEKAVQSGLTFAHSQSKITMHRWFRALFTTVSRNKKELCIKMWQWIKHGSTTSLWSQIGSQLSEQQQVKPVQSDQTQTSVG